MYVLTYSFFTRFMTACVELVTFDEAVRPYRYVFQKRVAAVSKYGTVDAAIWASIIKLEP